MKHPLKVRPKRTEAYTSRDHIQRNSKPPAGVGLAPNQYGRQCRAREWKSKHYEGSPDIAHHMVLEPLFFRVDGIARHVQNDYNKYKPGNCRKDRLQKNYSNFGCARC